MPSPATLDEWLAHCERLHSKSIDMTLQRVQLVRERLQLRFQVPVISVAGTNGKGSSCAMLESIALRSGYKVGLYIKPHLVHFEERCRVNGASLEARALLPHFAAVEAARLGHPQASALRTPPPEGVASTWGGPALTQDIALTYFEFTTLAIMRALSLAALDLVILEVGLGGRLDAVNVIDADCALITSIDLDHMEYLGHDRESIGFEKAGIMRAGKPAVVSDPVAPASVVRRARDVGADLWLAGRDFKHSGDRQQWSWSGRGRRRNALAYPALRGANQLLNASGVLAVFEALRDRLPVSAQAVRSGLATVELPGRFQIVPGQPALVLDVAHNPQATAALAYNLDQMGFFPRTHAVFGAMHDKDIAGMLKRLLPLVDAWYLCDLPVPRAASAEELARLVQGAAASRPLALTTHADPALALRAALRVANPADRIVVFGSFLCVGGVLKQGMSRLRAVSPG